MGKIIAKGCVKRKSGYLYYVDGKGNVCEAKMARGGKRKKKKAKKKVKNGKIDILKIKHNVIDHK